MVRLMVLSLFPGIADNKIVGQKSYRNLAEALKMNVSLQDVQVGCK